MKKISKVLCFLLSIASISLHAATVGYDANTPGSSAADIFAQSGYTAPNGVYWIDPDLPGGENPFQVYADMTSFGGGWTMAHDLDDILPTLFGHNDAMNILASDPSTQLRFVGSDFDAYYLGVIGNNLATASNWVIAYGGSSLELSALYGAAWGSSYLGNDVYIREATIIPYPAAVPVPAAVWLFGSGLIGLISVAKRKKA